MDTALLRKRMEADGLRLSKPSGAVVFDQGQPGKGAYLLKSGSMLLSLFDYSGAVVWSRMAKPGEILGLPASLGNSPYSLRATAVEPVELIFVPKSKIREFVRQDTAMSAAVLKTLSEQLVDLRRNLSLLMLAASDRSTT